MARLGVGAGPASYSNTCPKNSPEKMAIHAFTRSAHSGESPAASRALRESRAGVQRSEDVVATPDPAELTL